MSKVGNFIETQKAPIPPKDKYQQSKPQKHKPQLAEMPKFQELSRSQQQPHKTPKSLS